MLQVYAPKLEPIAQVEITFKGGPKDGQSVKVNEETGNYYYLSFGGLHYYKKEGEFYIWKGIKN